MQPMVIRQATKKQCKLRMALCGISGSGKTFTALTFAQVFGPRICVIDTERNSAELYADKFPPFDVLNLDEYSPEAYMAAIKVVEAGGFDMVIIDGLSQAWAGKDGSLEQVDKIAKRSYQGNKFGAWADVTPMQNRLVDAILAMKSHVIVTLRAKTEWVVETNERGKQAPRKVGLGPVQRKGLEYEFHLCADMDADNTLIVTKTRYSPLAKKVIECPGPEVALELKNWLDSGAVEGGDAAAASQNGPTKDPFAGLNDGEVTQPMNGQQPQPTQAPAPAAAPADPEEVFEALRTATTGQQVIAAAKMASGLDKAGRAQARELHKAAVDRLNQQMGLATKIRFEAKDAGLKDADIIQMARSAAVDVSDLKDLRDRPVSELDMLLDVMRQAIKETKEVMP